MAGRQSLHDIFKHELALLATIAKRLQIAGILTEVAVRQGYNDLFEALQLTPEPRRASRKIDGKQHEPES